MENTNTTRYTAQVVESSCELSPKQKLMLSDSSKHVSLSTVLDPDEETGEMHTIMIDVAAYAIVNIHNPKAKREKEYSYLIIVDKEGKTYFTGSQSFLEHFMGIWDVMKEYLDEFQIEVFAGESKNYDSGFLTCRLV